MPLSFAKRSIPTLARLSVTIDLDGEKSGTCRSFPKMEELQQRVYNLRSEKENADNQSEFSIIRSKDMVARIGDTKEIAELEKQNLSSRAAPGWSKRSKCS